MRTPKDLNILRRAIRRLASGTLSPAAFTRQASGDPDDFYLCMHRGNGQTTHYKNGRPMDAEQYARETQDNRQRMLVTLHIHHPIDES